MHFNIQPVGHLIVLQSGREKHKRHFNAKSPPGKAAPQSFPNKVSAKVGRRERGAALGDKASRRQTVTHSGSKEEDTLMPSLHQAKQLHRAFLPRSSTKTGGREERAALGDKASRRQPDRDPLWV